MSKRAQYGLIFSKIKHIDGSIFPHINPTLPVGPNSVLGFIRRLDERESAMLIDDLDTCIKSQSNFDEGFFSDSVEDMSILYKYPDIIIDDWYTISMEDLKELLQEWISFAFKN